MIFEESGIDIDIIDDGWILWDIDEVEKMIMDSQSDRTRIQNEKNLSCKTKPC